MLKQLSKIKESIDVKFEQMREQQDVVQQRDRQWVQAHVTKLFQQQSLLGQRVTDFESKLGRGLAELGGFRSGISDLLQDCVIQGENFERRHAELRRHVDVQLSTFGRKWGAVVHDGSHEPAATAPSRNDDVRLASIQAHIKTVDERLKDCFAGLDSCVQEVSLIRESITAQIGPIVESLKADIVSFKQALCAAEDVGLARHSSQQGRSVGQTQTHVQAHMEVFDIRLSTCEVALGCLKPALHAVGSEVSEVKKVLHRIAPLHCEPQDTLLDTLDMEVCSRAGIIAKVDSVSARFDKVFNAFGSRSGSQTSCRS